MLFDCVDGFSGLTCSALEYLHDEYSSKSIFSVPSVAASYPNCTTAQNCVRTVNSVLSFSELPELTSAFVPLSLASEGWNEPGSARKLFNINYNVSRYLL